MFVCDQCLLLPALYRTSDRLVQRKACPSDLLHCRAVRRQTSLPTGACLHRRRFAFRVSKDRNLCNQPQPRATKAELFLVGRSLQLIVLEVYVALIVTNRIRKLTVCVTSLHYGL